MTEKESTKVVETSSITQSDKDQTVNNVSSNKLKATQAKTIVEKEIKAKHKRKCTEKQLAALAAGRLKNPYYLAKLEREKQLSS